MPRKITRALRRLHRRRNTLKRGGATNKISELPDTFADFNWDMYYLMAHGGLTGGIFRVPERTYILNLSAAGKGCNKMAYDIEKLIFEHPPAAAAAAAAGAAGAAGTVEPPKPVREVIFDKLKDGTFLKEDELEDMAEFVYNPKRSGGPSGLGDRSIAFYEPGDLLVDNRLTFFNTELPYTLMGLYEIPVPFEEKRRIFLKNREYGVIQPGTQLKDMKANNYRLVARRTNANANTFTLRPSDAVLVRDNNELLGSDDNPSLLKNAVLGISQLAT